MSSNTRCSDMSRSEGIQRLVWPARSPDLNAIENVWDALGRQISGRNYPPRNKNTLIRALTEEWDKLPQQLLDNVVQSMVRRVVDPKKNITSHSILNLHIVEKFCFLGVETKGATCHTAGLRVGSESPHVI
ncbi:hypothetical protein TNCV_1337101 [Trichonephila clavipes]|nr:hypothetical protein TNCV_1337101 [Trichonephila clavipes]